MASPNTLALRTTEPKEPCVPPRPHPAGHNHAPFHYYDGNREARRHPELHGEVWAIKRQLLKEGLL